MTNREIDALIAQHVMGKVNVREFRGRYVWDNVGCVNGEPVGDVMGIIDVPEYSADISAAWQVVEKFERYAVRKVTDGHKAAVINPIDDGWDDAIAETAPMAICLAALKTKGVDISENQTA